MKRVYYNKLIRDNIPEKIVKGGGEFEVRELKDEEYQQELLKKIAEEAGGLSRSRTKEDFLDELADLYAVIEALKKLEGITEEEVVKAIEDNRLRKGGFDKKLFLHWSSDNNYKSNETPQGMK
ncbi:MAG: nucleoside triphosphate pyrophosphohydrolase [Candidatus Paceibacterota bacterium]|jgi:predicted house-cleaning noncanonical NTP pyrophosphatase (MazG superfamily)